MSFYMMEKMERMQEQIGRMQQTIDDMRTAQEQPDELINPIEKK